MPIDPAQLPLWFALGTIACLVVFVLKVREKKRPAAYLYLLLTFITASMCLGTFFYTPADTEVTLRPAIDASTPLLPEQTGTRCTPPPTCLTGGPCSVCKDI